MTNVIEQLGAWAVFRVREMGRMLLFVLSAFAWLVRPPFRFHQIMKQLHFVGYRSTFVVVLTAGFTGMVLALQPVVALSCVGVFIFVLYLTRYVSLSSILAALMLPICVLWIWNENEVLYRVFTLLVALLVLFTHQKNIGRLLRGVESRIPILKHRDRRKTRRRGEE